jgi:hypothetical protein
MKRALSVALVCLATYGCGETTSRGVRPTGSPLARGTVTVRLAAAKQVNLDRLTWLEVSDDGSMHGFGSWPREATVQSLRAEIKSAANNGELVKLFGLQLGAQGRGVPAAALETALRTIVSAADNNTAVIVYIWCPSTDGKKR